MKGREMEDRGRLMQSTVRAAARACAAGLLVLVAAGGALAQKAGGYSFGALLPLSGAQADRGKTSKTALDLAQADPGAFDALVLPGGFGVAKSQVTLESGELNRQKRVRIRAPQKLPAELAGELAAARRP